MKIAVYCASANGTDSANWEAAQALGEWIGKNGHTLVYGGSKQGLMGTVANAALAAGAEVIGVLPQVENIPAYRHTGITRTIEARDTTESKQIMIDMADACVALPGGIGTLDEITDVLFLARLGIYGKPCVLYSVDGFWDPLTTMLRQMTDAGFIKENGIEGLLVSDDLIAIASHITRWHR